MASKTYQTNFVNENLSIFNGGLEDLFLKSCNFLQDQFLRSYLGTGLVKN